MAPGHGSELLLEGLDGFFGSLVGSEATPLVVPVSCGTAGVVEIALGLA